jgi:hypothetical protein
MDADNAKNVIDARSFDPEWLAQHPDILRTWSPFDVLWAMGHDFMILTGSSGYQLTFRTYGFVSREQEQAYTALEVEWQNVQLFRERFKDIYVRYKVASRAGTVPVERDSAYEVAETLIRTMYAGLSISVPVLCDVGDSLADGRYGYTNEQQASLLQVLATLNVRLLYLVHFLGGWITARDA